MGTIGEMKNKAYIIGGAVAVIIAIGIVIAVVQGSRGAPEWIAIRDNILPQFTTVLVNLLSLISFLSCLFPMFFILQR